jgi:hypothetical protein
MDMEYGLAGGGIAVHDDSIALFGAAGVGSQGGGGLHESAQHFGVLGSDIVESRDVFSGDDEYMLGGLGRYIAKSQYLVILENDIRGDVPAGDVTK